MKKSKIAFHIVSWSVAIIAALVILLAVLFTEYVTPRLIASAEVSTIESNVMYEFSHTIASGEGNVIPTTNYSKATIGYDYSPYIYLNDIQLKRTSSDYTFGYFYLTGWASYNPQTNSEFGSYYGVYELNNCVSFYIGANSTLVGVRLWYNTNLNTDSSLPAAGYYAIDDVDFSIKIMFHNWRDPVPYDFLGRFLKRTLNPEVVPDPIVVSSDYYNTTPTEFEPITTAGTFTCTGTVYDGFMQNSFSYISVYYGSTVQDLDIGFLDSEQNIIAGWVDGEWIFLLHYDSLPLYPSDGEVRVVFSSAGNISGKYLYNLNQIISTPIVPIFGEIIDVYQEMPRPNVQGGLNFYPSTVRLKAVELLNASDFVRSASPAEGTYYYVDVFFDDTMTSEWNGVTKAYSDSDSRWWLLFSLPNNIAYNVRLSYYDDMIHYTELSYEFVPGTTAPLVLDAFVHNYMQISYGLATEFEIAAGEGFSDGWADGYSDNNNLISVMWATFEFPFRILFGTYNSSTHFYEGGLFNFTILGLDIRAFVLSVISVCLIVAIIKLILGARGGGSNG